MKKYFRKAARTSLVLIYLVIIAGAVVRMTGSGMGCPDWPKCFGYYIPPTEEAELQWQPNTFYKEGRIIIVKEELRIAPADFTSSDTFSESNWEAYTKHDYAIFNPLHTWIEYLNRLLGALSGIPILIMAILSFWLFRDNKWFTVLSMLTVLGMAFQAWLGKTVVDSNLAPFKITIHMVMALIIVAFLLYLLHLAKDKRNPNYDPLFRNLVVVALGLTLIQIVMGTQVRQFVDEQVKLVGYDHPETWLAYPELDFYIHRTFSIVVFVLNAYLWMRNRKLGLQFNSVNWVMIFIFVEIFTGILMYYVDFPFGTQPLHLVVAALLFGVQFHLLLQSQRVAQTAKSL